MDEEPGPLQGLPFYDELARVPPGHGPVHWDVARRVAVWVAGGGSPEAPVAEDAVASLRELGRVAELQIEAVLGRAPAPGPLTIFATTRAEWALRSIDAQVPLLETLARTLAGDHPPGPGDRPGGLAPDVLEGLVFGWMMGQLSRRALGSYDPPLPRPPVRLVVPVANLDEVAATWGLPVDEVRLWACLQDAAHHSVLTLPHVSNAIGGLLRRHAEGFVVEDDALDDRLADVDPTDLGSFRAALGEPEALVASVQTPEQAEVAGRLEALAAAMEGWVAWVVDGAASRLLGSWPSLQEALRRRRAEASWGERYVARLLGMGLRQPAYERGRRFVDGVLERGGEEALARLWASERELPTPAEVDGPGLWLARIDLPPA